MTIKDGAVLAAAWAASLVFLHNLCNLIFQCGCTWVWAGGASRCNVHNSAPPHCPWCSHGWAGFLWVPALILPAEAAAVLGLRRRGILVQLVAAGVIYLVVGSAAGLISAWIDGYPTWLGLSLR